MPERENPEPSSHSLSDDLFSKLPEPSHRAPASDSTPPVPGSRRARREAAQTGQQAGSFTPKTGGDPESTPEQTTAQQPTGESTATTAGPETSAAETPAPETAAVEPSASAAVPGAATLDDLFEADHTEVGHTKKAKKKRRTGCLVALAIVLAILGGLTAGGFWAWNTYGDKISDVMGWGPPADWEPGIATGEVFVTIRDGDTGGPVSTALYEAGVTRTEDVFYDYLVDENIAVTFYPGVYKLQEKMTAEAALTAIQDPASKAENTASVPEGSTLEYFLPTMAESLGIPIEDFQAAVKDPSAYGVEADSLEGWLFPAVYTFDPEVTAKDVIQRMVDRTRESLAAAGVPEGDEQRVLTIASIIQREGHTEDFPKVSRVIVNRLQPGNDETHGLLQMDSTAQYGVGELHAGSAGSSEKALTDPNPWNTYIHPGLPKGPIATASDAAIDAAMHPADGPWFYFVTVNLNTGETVFSATYAEQTQAEKKLHEWCQANPDSGCYAG
ncbi:endolytic transglycosylase MltG [Microbacterium sp. Bi121]|uniref:endolytic transglycosylase MltG n=1 Tax=Microbacterium sp. Bi121 TaxID=2822348 RepID=UPI001D971835|nr:endolytic transglycosylase MltG [Microbacterium sp. Bi121]CAH0176080.1 Endolytic murein transglycosylase [Microbacterium sp. Bi121]